MIKIICVAGFGDDASMFAPLIDASAGLAVQFHPINLPGFGATPLNGQKTTLESMAAYLVKQAEDTGANTVLAHSVASIIASMAANRMNSPLNSILSLEGNLTPEDAYFSGTAANYSSADEFRVVFLNRLDDMAKSDPVIGRYRDAAGRADPQALWELGCDAHKFSNKESPGKLLQATENAAYIFNPKNVPSSSMSWLNENSLMHFELPGASHWASVDQPSQLAGRIAEALKEWKN